MSDKIKVILHEKVILNGIEYPPNIPVELDSDYLYRHIYVVDVEEMAAQGLEMKEVRSYIEQQFGRR